MALLLAKPREKGAGFFPSVGTRDN